MPKSELKPLSPTVSSVFSQFKTNLETDAAMDEETIARLVEALNAQKIDAVSLRSALFDLKKIKKQ